MLATGFIYPVADKLARNAFLVEFDLKKKKSCTVCFEFAPDYFIQYDALKLPILMSNVMWLDLTFITWIHLLLLPNFSVLNEDSHRFTMGDNRVTELLVCWTFRNLTVYISPTSHITSDIIWLYPFSTKMAAKTLQRLFIPISVRLRSGKSDDYMRAHSSVSMTSPCHLTSQLRMSSLPPLAFSTKRPSPNLRSWTTASHPEKWTNPQTVSLTATAASCCLNHSLSATGAYCCWILNHNLSLTVLVSCSLISNITAMAASCSWNLMLNLKLTTSLLVTHNPKIQLTIYFWRRHQRPHRCPSQPSVCHITVAVQWNYCRNCKRQHSNCCDVRSCTTHPNTNDCVPVSTVCALFRSMEQQIATVIHDAQNNDVNSRLSANIIELKSQLTSNNTIIKDLKRQLAQKVQSNVSATKWGPNYLMPQMHTPAWANKCRWSRDNLLRLENR